MSGKTTNFGPRVSLTTTLSDAGPPHLYLDSNTTFTAAGTNVLSGAITASGALTATGGLTVGATGDGLTLVKVSTASVNPGAVAGHESLTTAVTIAGITTDSLVLGMQPASIWSGAYYDLNYTSHVSIANTVTVALTNSAATSVTPAAMNWKFFWVDPA